MKEKKETKNGAKVLVRRLAAPKPRGGDAGSGPSKGCLAEAAVRQWRVGGPEVNGIRNATKCQNYTEWVA
jgi:hypothetical protein